MELRQWATLSANHHGFIPMALLDQYGVEISYTRTFAHGADRSRTRGPQYETRDIDIDKLIPSHDRKRLVSLSKRLFTNIGVPKAIVTQKADYSVGGAWRPSYGGPDKEAGDEVEAWLENVWFPNCEVRGGIHDWHQVLLGVSADIDFGDSFTLKTVTADGKFPLLQNIPSHRIESGSDYVKVSTGRYKGRKIHDGIIYSDQNRPIAYRVMSEDRMSFEDIPAQSIIHIFDPDFNDQGRGLPVFTHAVEDLKHCLQSTEYERIRQLIISSIGLVEYNDTGGPDMDDPRFALSAATTTEAGVAFESYQGGSIRYMRANSGNKLESIKHDNPGDVWESFQDRMIRMSIIGASWSYSMVWKGAGQGTAERADILRARRAVDKRQRLLAHFARQAVGYAVGVATANGRVTRVDGSTVTVLRPLRWAFSKPPRLTIDDGREDKALIEGWRAGTRNLTEVIEANGRSIEEFTRERAEEIALRKTIAAEVAIARGVEIEDREMAMLTANEMATTQPQADPTE